MKIAVAGLGLIGGSFALALKKRTSHTVLGLDADPETVRAAISCGAVDEIISPDRLDRAELSLIALPPRAALTFLQEQAPRFAAGSLVADLCGAKEKIVAAGEAALHPRTAFLGCHPMAGKEKGGFANASADLFEGASLILTPTPNTPPKAVKVLTDLAAEVGFGRVALSSPAEHDRIIAFTSQLCHAVSGAYVQSPMADLAAGFTGGSYEDFTRVAEMDPALWSQLFAENRENLLAELAGLRERLAELEGHLRRGEEEALRALLQSWSDRKKELLRAGKTEA